ncbi:LEA type 2 family protein [Alloalcanivorax gelatiniphagus]|uniref:LEA type 2 family protein n=1 Tax=Alloalcanivorax gelatiniphagus TaxID=1194167 RepID=A0ABY2XLZ8_9GAMM|nr:LEA type 2 family protein [Alloalcanivorax gelatiniphagus]TMW12589.1 LEA type 2 family protein [Alloalcanivorax gelatiniphagus]
MRTLARIGVLGLLALLSACQTLTGLEAPEVNLSSLRLEQVSVFEQQWQVVLRARNPNDRELTLKSLDYELFVNGEKLARGLTGDDVTLPAMGDALVTTRITTSLMQTLGKLKGLQQDPGAPLDYRIKGTARVKGLALPLSFDQRGEFRLPDTLPLR